MFLGRIHLLPQRLNLLILVKNNPLQLLIIIIGYLKHLVVLDNLLLHLCLLIQGALSGFTEFCNFSLQLGKIYVVTIKHSLAMHQNSKRIGNKDHGCLEAAILHEVQGVLEHLFIFENNSLELTDFRIQLLLLDLQVGVICE